MLKTLGKMQPRIVAVPVGGKIHTVKVSADGREAAVTMAKQLLIESGDLCPQQDIRLVSQVVTVKAPEIGSNYGDNVEKAIQEAKELVGV